MRITGGSAKGRAVTTPDGLEVRPTLAKVRQAFFNIVGNNLQGHRFLDLCAGSGLMGLEALSRGASSAIFVEESRRMSKIIGSNIKHLGFEKEAEVICADIKRAIPTLEPGAFDVIFVDPPYASKLSEIVVGLIDQFGLLADDGVLVIEHTTTKAGPPQRDGQLVRTQEREYGQTILSFYKNQSPG